MPQYSRIKDPRSIPIPTDITSPSDLCEHFPLQASWGNISPVIYSRPVFSAPSTIDPAPHATYAPPPQSTPAVDINAIVKAVVQTTLASNNTLGCGKPDCSLPCADTHPDRRRTPRPGLHSPPNPPTASRNFPPQSMEWGYPLLPHLSGMHTRLF